MQKLRSGGAIPVLLPYAFMTDELQASCSAAPYAYLLSTDSHRDWSQRTYQLLVRHSANVTWRRKAGNDGTSASATYRLQKAYDIKGLGKLCTKANAKSLRATKYVLRHQDVSGEQKLQLLAFLIFRTRSGEWSSVSLVRFTPKITPNSHPVGGWMGPIASVNALEWRWFLGLRAHGCVVTPTSCPMSWSTLTLICRAKIRDGVYHSLTKNKLH
jgi:hypothetical protein